MRSPQLSRHRHPHARRRLTPGRVVLVTLALVAVVLGRLPVSGAAFTSANSNAGSSFSSGTVAGPTGLSATKTCVAQPVTGATPAYQTMTSTTGTASSGTSTFTISKPAGTTAGDLLILQLGFPKDSATMSWGTSLPTGWIVNREDVGYGGTGHSVVLFLVAGASEPASYTFPIWVGSGGPYQWSAAMLRISGVDTRNPIDAHAGTFGASSTTINYPGLTAVSDNDLLVSFAMVNAQTTFTAPTGMSEVYDFKSGTTVTVEAATASAGNAGTVATSTGSVGAAGAYGTQLVAIRPAAAQLAPLQYGNSSNYYATGGGSMSLTKPTGLTTGDLLLIGATWTGGTGSAPTTPTGFTKLRVDTNSSTVSAGWWYRVTTGSETWPISVGPSPATGAELAVLGVFRYIDTTNPIAGSTVDNTHTGTTLTAPAVTVTPGHSAVFHLLANNDSSTILRPVAGSSWDTYGYAHYNSTYINGTFGHDTATSTTTATHAFTTPNSTPWIAESLALNPAPETYVINANLSWTVSTTTWANGYSWERWTGTLQQTGTVSGRTTVTATDTDTLTAGTTYTYKVRTTTPSTWTSAQVTTNLTPSTCP
jgi:hypothetical protein